MKKVLQWIGITAAYLGLGTMMFFGIPFLLGLLMVFGLESEHAAMDDHAEAALRETGLTAYTEYATWHDLTIDGTLTAFVMPKYDNHVDNTDLRAGLMALAAGTDGWHVEAVSAADYAARIPAGAAFLLPDVTFDAWFESAEDMAFFDQESGLFVHLREGEAPKSGTIRADKLAVPHDGYVYTMETHGGLLGDGTTYQALIVPEEKRTTLEATLSAHGDWHAGAVTHAEYVQLHDHEFYSLPELYPADDVIFDWWCYVNTYTRDHPDFVSEYTPDNSDFPAVMRAAGARPAGNWLIALFDPDTGLFIYYEYDS
ncbi:MAG: hypothetical protein E7318_03180 [Clostridiales bacterium]|nr:hypothetical protein [Clostridiales bacterium]